MMGELEKVERPCDPKRELKQKLISSSVSNFKWDNVNVMSLDVGADFKFICHVYGFSFLLQATVSDSLIFARAEFAMKLFI